VTEEAANEPSVFYFEENGSTVFRHNFLTFLLVGAAVAGSLLRGATPLGKTCKISKNIE
jgi:hypothetical protein